MTEHSFVPHVHRRGGFIERLTGALLAVLEHALDCERLARGGGLLQRFDPRVKVLGALILIGVTVSVQRVPTILGLLAGAVVVARLSRVPIRTLASGVWSSVLLFTGAIALPAVFIVPGEVLYRLPGLDWPLTVQGVESATLLISRALTAATFAALLILSTPWPQVLKALRVLGVPAVVVMILSITHRYLFLLLQTAQALFEARQSRLVGRLSGRERRRLVIASTGVLLSKSLQLADEVFLAMQSRGYRGEHLILTDFQMKPLDWAGAGVIIALAALALRLGF